MKVEHNGNIYDINDPLAEKIIEVIIGDEMKHTKLAPIVPQIVPVASTVCPCDVCEFWKDDGSGCLTTGIHAKKTGECWMQSKKR